jgi:hypothetical protein
LLVAVSILIELKPSHKFNLSQDVEIIDKNKGFFHLCLDNFFFFDSLEVDSKPNSIEVRCPLHQYTHIILIQIYHEFGCFSRAADSFDTLAMILIENMENV